MGQPIFGTPFGHNEVSAYPKDLQYLIHLGRALSKLAERGRQLDEAHDRVQQGVAEVYAAVRLLQGLTDLLAEQPGFGAGDIAAQQKRKDLGELKKKVDAFRASLAGKCPLDNAVPIVAPTLVSSRRTIVDEIAKLVQGTQGVRLPSESDEKKSIDIVEAFQKSKAISDAEKEAWLQSLVYCLQFALELAHRSEFSPDLARMIDKAVLRQRDKNLIDACLNGVGALASATGNLPGPDSAYIAIVRLRALYQLHQLVNRPNLRDKESINLREQLAEGLRFNKRGAEASKGESAIKAEAGGNKSNVALEVEFYRELDSVNQQRLKLRRLREGKALGRGDAEAIHLSIDKSIGNVRKTILERTGRMQTSPVYNWGITIANTIQLIAKLESDDDVDSDGKLTSALDKFLAYGALTNAGLGAASGLAVSIDRTVVSIPRVKTLFALMEKTAGTVGDKVITPLTGALALVDGLMKLSDELDGQRDPWKLTMAGVETASGTLIVASLFFSACPGLQPLGALLGVVSGVLGIIDGAVQASKDPMKETVLKLIDDIATKKLWNDVPLAEKLGLASDVADLKKAVESCGVGVVEMDPTQAGVSEPQIHERIRSLGLSESAAQALAVRQSVVAKLSKISDPRAREAEARRLGVRTGP
ncbi:MAG: hypothetical protein QM820_09255 [Minicystis sp.]